MGVTVKSAVLLFIYAWPCVASFCIFNCEPQRYVTELHIANNPGQYHLEDTQRECNVQRKPKEQCTRTMLTSPVLPEGRLTRMVDMERGFMLPNVVASSQSVCESLLSFPSNDSSVIETRRSEEETLTTIKISEDRLIHSLVDISALDTLEHLYPIFSDRHFSKEDLLDSVYSSFTVRIYEVRLKKFSLSSEALEAFQAVSSNPNSTIDDFYVLTRKFGNFFWVSLLYGGTVQLLTKCIDNCDQFALPEAWMNTPLSTLSSMENVILFHIRGGEASNLSITVSDWRNTVRANPVPLFGFQIPIGNVLENTTDITHCNLQLLTASEQSLYRMREIKTLIQIASDPTCQLRNFILNAIDKDARQVCPNERLLDALNTGILTTRNIGLDQFYVNCTGQAIWNPEQRQYETIITQLRVLPEICMVISDKMKNCTNYKYMLPTGMKCLKFFDSPNCNQTNDIGTAKTSIAIKSMMENAGSFMICNDKRG